MGQDDLRAKYMPTEEEIRRICQDEIQPTWDEEERLNRTRSDEKPVAVKWEVPVYPVTALPELVQEVIFSLNKELD